MNLPQKTRNQVIRKVNRTKNLMIILRIKTRENLKIVRKIQIKVILTVKIQGLGKIKDSISKKKNSKVIVRVDDNKRS